MPVSAKPTLFVSDVSPASRRSTGSRTQTQEASGSTTGQAQAMPARNNSLMVAPSARVVRRRSRRENSSSCARSRVPSAGICLRNRVPTGGGGEWWRYVVTRATPPATLSMLSRRTARRAPRQPVRNDATRQATPSATASYCECGASGAHASPVGFRHREVRRQSEGHGDDRAHRGGAVGHGMVVRAEKAKRAVRERFDDLDAPERSLGVQRNAERFHQKLADGVGRYRSRCRIDRDVVADVKLGIVLPVGTGQVGGDTADPLAARPHCSVRLAPEDQVTRVRDDLLGRRHRAVEARAAPKKARHDRWRIEVKLLGVNTAQVVEATHAHRTLLRRDPPGRRPDTWSGAARQRREGFIAQGVDR